MKDMIFALAAFGLIISWMVWGILVGNECYKQKARCFMITGSCCTAFAIGWSIKYGA